jgi:hypothetical protein
MGAPTKKHVTCDKCKKEHYASFAECPYCFPEEAEARQEEPDYDTDEARASYAAIGSRHTWDGRKETADDPFSAQQRQEKSE